MSEEKSAPRSGEERHGSSLRSAMERGVEELGLDKVNFVKEALNWQYNWIGLAGAAAFALISGTGLPLVLAAGLELIYLSLVPQSSRFRRLVRSWKYAEEKRLHEQRLAAIFHELPAEMRKRYVELEELCRDIQANYARLSSTSQIFVQNMGERLQGLLQAYLRLLSSQHHHEEYLFTAEPAQIQHEIARLQGALDSDAPKVQEINRKRIEILSKRLEKFEKIRENRQVIEAQCGATEDVLGLIRDQSVTVRDPQEVSHQLETLLHDVEETEQAVREVEAIFDLATPELVGMLPLPESGPSSSPQQRTSSPPMRRVK
jgi:hypothetical protein